MQEKAAENDSWLAAKTLAALVFRVDSGKNGPGDILQSDISHLLLNTLLRVRGNALKLSTAQIGKCGELLVQYRLLLIGIESAPMSTDTGIDLVAYSPTRKHPATIQVKTNLKPKPGGGKGKAALDWWLPESSPAELVAFVNLEDQSIWMMTHQAVNEHAQQRSKGRLHLYMYTAKDVAPRKSDRLVYSYDFEKFKLENCAGRLFST